MIHLHVHTYYSFHEGASSPEELFEAARERGINTLAVTDTNGLYGLIHQRKAAEQYGLRLLIGAWLDDTAGHSAVILPRTRHGYSRLCQLITWRHMDPQFSLPKSLREEDLSQLFVLSPDIELLTGLPREKTVFFELRPGAIHRYRAARDRQIPAVVTNVKGNREAVEQGRNGLLVPLDDISALADAIIKLITDPRKAKRMGQEGRRMALKHFDEQRVFKKVRVEYARQLRAKGLFPPKPCRFLKESAS